MKKSCTLSVNSEALDTYRQELLHHCTYHRITLFLRQLLITIKTADTGFIICWLAHQPVHMRYLGPSRAKHLYLLRLHDTLEILLFKYGGEPVHICRPPGIAPCLVFKQTPRGLELNMYVLLRSNKNASARLPKSRGHIVLLSQDVPCGDFPTFC